MISLYVDDKQKLPADKRFVYTMKDGTQKEINTVGDLWATFETEIFSNNAQPLYAILNTREELLTEPLVILLLRMNTSPVAPVRAKEFNK